MSKEHIMQAMNQLRKACEEQYQARGSCKNCPLYDSSTGPLYNEDGKMIAGNHFCTATYPLSWLKQYPELLKYDKLLSKDQRTVCVFAFRYSLNRRTYAFSIVTDEIKKHIDDFEDWELEQMQEDCVFPADLALIDDCDRVERYRFSEYLLKILEERKHEQETKNC